MIRTWVGSPNYTPGRGGKKISGWVVHWMAGRMASADSVFQDELRNTSAHSGFEDDKIHDYVHKADTAYQAGNYAVNEVTLGYEVSAEPGRTPSDASYENLAQEIAQDAKAYNLPVNEQTVRFHFQIVSTRCNENIVKARIIARVNEILGGAAPKPTPAPAPIPSNIAGTAKVIASAGVNVRSAPSVSAGFAGIQHLSQGQTFRYRRAVQGDNVSGVSTWLESEYGNYVWAGALDYATSPLVDNHAGTVQILVDGLNARTAPNTAGAVAGQFQKGSAQYKQVTIGQMVTVNGKTSNVWLMSLNNHWFAAAGTSY